MRNPKILIVDDEKKNIKLIKGMLFSMPYQLFEALSGEEAVDMTHKINPDLILLDVMMPGTNGFEVCKILKDDKKYKSIPIIMVTALNENKHRVKAMELGADDFISKPLNSTELIIRVKSLIRIKSYYDEISCYSKEIDEKNKKLLNLEKIKDSLVHMIVHDLRNPLWAVFGYIDLMLLDKDNLSQNQIKNLETCIGACNDLKRMIDSLLDIYKMEEGRMKLERKKIVIAKLIDDSIKPFYINASKNRISIEVNHSSENLSLQIDPILVKRVLANLMNNAIRHTPPEGKISISTASYQNNGNILIEVRDTGNGVDPAHQQKIFDKFEQIKIQKSNKSVGSSGLGLAFCKLAIEAHGGVIWVESEGEGKGTNFKFTLPANN